MTSEQRERLFPGVFGEEFDHIEGPFGLSTGQMRVAGKITHNSGWYNSNGEKLGFGDLSTGDFRRIAAELEENEAFVILYEGDSLWHFGETNPGTIGSMVKTRPKEIMPGIGYVAQHCGFIIRKGVIYSVGFETRRLKGLELIGISRQQAVDMLLPSQER